MKSLLVKLPGAQTQKIAAMQAEKNTLHLYLLLLVIAVVVIAFGSFLIFVKLKKLKAREKITAKKNAMLEQINATLNDQALMRERYIGYFFSMISDYIVRLEKLKRGVERKVMVKKYDDILLSFNEINIKKERENLFSTFDNAFLTIFPNFINDFNGMLNKEDQIWPPKANTLTKELRIFALMRLGITDCDTVASILEYTANTIYVYKMRIKAKSVFTAEQFYQQLMTIKAANPDEPLPLRKSA